MATKARHPDERFESYIQHGRDGSTMYVGDLALKLAQGMALRTFLADPIGPASERRLMTTVQAFTGRKPRDRIEAMADLDHWIAGMELVVPILQES